MHYKRKKWRGAYTGRIGWSLNSWRKKNGLSVVHSSQGRVRYTEWHPWKHGMNNPAWWDLLFHTRPWRAESRRLERAILRGADPDETVWPTHHRPHIYFW